MRATLAVWLEGFELQHFLLLAAAMVAVGLVSGGIVVKRELGRELPTQWAVLERDISELQAILEELKKTPGLKGLYHNWEYAKTIGNAAGAEVFELKDIKHKYQGPTKSWYGALRGPTNSVLSAALILQQRVPVQYTAIVVQDGKTVLSFSLLGTNEH